MARLETKKLRSPRETSCNLADECYVTKRDIRASCVLRDDQRGLRPRMLQVRLRGLPASLPLCLARFVTELAEISKFPRGIINSIPPTVNTHRVPVQIYYSPPFVHHLLPCDKHGSPTVENGFHLLSLSLLIFPN